MNTRRSMRVASSLYTHVGNGAALNDSMCVQPSGDTAPGYWCDERYAGASPTIHSSHPETMSSRSAGDPVAAASSP